MQSSRGSQTGRDSGHHGLAVVGRTARGGRAHGRVPGAASGLCRFRVAFRLPVAFALFFAF